MRKKNDSLLSCLLYKLNFMLTPFWLSRHHFPVCSLNGHPKAHIRQFEAVHERCTNVIALLKWHSWASAVSATTSGSLHRLPPSFTDRMIPQLRIRLPARTTISPLSLVVSLKLPRMIQYFVSEEYIIARNYALCIEVKPRELRKESDPKSQTVTARTLTQPSSLLFRTLLPEYSRNLN